MAAEAVPENRQLPGWSDYLVRLGSQVKKAASTPIWPPEKPGAQHFRPRRGDRRRSVEQRIAEAGVANPAPDTPQLTDYLAKLGGQVTQAATPKQWLFADAASPEPAVEIRRPIGDRRVRDRPRRAEPVEIPLSKRITLGNWSYYFLAKLGLFWAGLIAFHPLENLVFAALILIPASYLRRVKHVVTTVLALALLYYDSWLPPVRRLISQAKLLSDFSPGYLLELLTRFVSLTVLVALFASWLLCWIMARWVRIDAVAVLGMLGLGVFHMLPAGVGAEGAMPDMDHVLQDFFAKEASRAVLFVAPQADAVPFDVIFIHVCSLAWDDVVTVGLDHHPLWQRFDMLLTRFNSATSYSGPAAIHLMRAKCGQTEHGNMYLPVADKCYLMKSLQLSGFEENVALNHDGKFDDFIGQLKKHGRLETAPLPLGGLEPAQYAFDKSPVYDDLSVLNRWLDERQKSASSRVALYYNTVSMHDGNHFPGVDSEPNTTDTYKARLSKFLDELDAFMQKLDQSGRRAVVVMVPEHGAALRGDKRQIAGLREIPTPAITIVPVGIRLVGGNLRHESTRQIDQPTSYLAISQIIERMLEQSPFATDRAAMADYADDLPLTPFVAQNEANTVVEYENRFYLGRGVGKWERYSEFNKTDGK